MHTFTFYIVSVLHKVVKIIHFATWHMQRKGKSRTNLEEVGQKYNVHAFISVTYIVFIMPNKPGSTTSFSQSVIILKCDQVFKHLLSTLRGQMSQGQSIRWYEPRRLDRDC